MSQPKTPTPETLKDPDLIAWLSAGGEEERELIVEARTPPRRVSFQKRSDGRAIPVAIDSPPSSQRAAVLEQLSAFLADELHLSAKVLTAAGALVVRATGPQIEQLADHPLVKAIRPNRRLA